MEIATGLAAPIVGRDRESVANYQMSTKEDQFTDLQNFSFFIGTWNVNGQSPGLFCEIKIIDLFSSLSLSLSLFKSIFKEMVVQEYIPENILIQKYIQGNGSLRIYSRKYYYSKL